MVTEHHSCESAPHCVENRPKSFVFSYQPNPFIERLLLNRADTVDL